MPRSGCRWCCWSPAARTRRGRRWRRIRVSCPFPPREIGRFGRGLAWRAALIGPGLEPAFDDRQQTLKRVGHALLLKPSDLMAHLDLEGLGDLSCAVASAPP